MDSWIDNHCHIPGGSEGDVWVEAARAAGVSKLITVGVTVERSREAIAVASATTGSTQRLVSTLMMRRMASRGWPSWWTPKESWRSGSADSTIFMTTHRAMCSRPYLLNRSTLAHTNDLPLVIHTPRCVERYIRSAR